MTADRLAVCCDLDGVVWRGEDIIPGAAEAIARLRAARFRVGLVASTMGDTGQANTFGAE